MIIKLMFLWAYRKVMTPIVMSLGGKEFIRMPQVLVDSEQNKFKELCAYKWNTKLKPRRSKYNSVSVSEGVY